MNIAKTPLPKSVDPVKSIPYASAPIKISNTTTETIAAPVSNPYYIWCTPTIRWNNADYLEPLKTVQNSKEKENNMAVEKTEAQVKTDYLLRRLDDANYSASRKFRAAFGWDAPTTPRTYKELIDAIKNDKFTINEKRAKDIDEDFAEYLEERGTNGGGDYWYANPFDGLKFTDFPGYDAAGYEIARKELAKKHQETKDAIMVFPADQALKALKAFEDWTPSNLPKN